MPLYHSQESLCQSRSHDVCIVIAADERYFPYELIQVQNFAEVFKGKIDVIAIHSSSITSEQVEFLNQVFPEVKQAYCQDLEFINSFSDFFSNNLWCDILGVKFFCIYLSRFYKNTIFIDTDTLIFSDFTQEIADLLEKAEFAAMLRPFSLPPREPVLTLIASMLNLAEISCPQHEENKLNYAYPKAGFFALSHNFCHDIEISKIKEQILKILIYCKKNFSARTFSNFGLDELIYWALTIIYEIKIQDTPPNLHACTNDLLVNAPREIHQGMPILSIHTPGGFKLWNDPFLLECFPEYLTLTRVLIGKAESLKHTDYALELTAELQKITDLKSNNYVAKIRKFALLHLYQELQPDLCSEISHSRYFEIRQTLSEDRIILWSKYHLNSLRIDLTPAQVCRDSAIYKRNFTETNRFLPTKMFITIRYGIYNSNCDAADLTKSSQVKFFSKLKQHFANSDLKVTPVLISLVIECDTLSFKAVFNKLEKCLNLYHEDFLKL